MSFAGFAGFKEGRVTVGTSDIFFLTGGSGPPLLLLHGYPQTHVAWHRVARRLAGTFTVILPDLPGYGASRGPEPDEEHRNYSKRSLAAVFYEMMLRLGHERFLLAGHDRGGRIGYRLCLDRPDAVRRLIVLDIVPTLDAWEAMDGRQALSTFHWPFLAAPKPIPESLLEGRAPLFVEQLLRNWAGDFSALDARAVEAYLKAYERPGVVAASLADYRAGATRDWEDDAADRAAGRRISCPLLVIWGRRYLASRVSSPLAVWQLWADKVEEVAIEGCGHFLAEEAPEICVEAMVRFFTAEPT